MQLIGLSDPSLGPGKIATGVAAKGGVVILHNLSPYDLMLTFGENATDPSRQALLMAWQPREFDFCGQTTLYIFYKFANAVGNLQVNSPSSVILGEAFAPGETKPVSYPNYTRLTNLGNAVLPVSSVQAVINNGNPPGSQFIESTPSDQTQPSLSVNNDGTIIWQVLSSSVLRNVLTIIRGTIGAVDAQVIIGDAADPNMTILHGTADTAATAGFSTTSGESATTQQIAVYDGSAVNVNNVTHYEGLTDPSTYLVPADGDLWFDG